MKTPQEQVAAIKALIAESDARKNPMVHPDYRSIDVCDILAVMGYPPSRGMDIWDRTPLPRG